MRVTEALRQLLGPLLAATPPWAAATIPNGSGLVALARAHARFPRPFAKRRTRYGFAISGHTQDLIQRYIYVFGVWEPNLSRWIYDFLRPNDIVLDIGANIGYIALLSASRVGDGGRVYAFEPMPSIVDKLRENIALNGYSNVVIVPNIVSDASGTAEVFRSRSDNLGMSSTLGGTGYSSEGSVAKVRVTDVIRQSEWRSIRLVKIDVEGDEVRVLAGMGPILEAMPLGAAVVVEITPDLLARRGDSPHEVVEFLGARGFHGHIIPNSYDPRSYVSSDSSNLSPIAGEIDRVVDAIFIKRS